MTGASAQDWSRSFVFRIENAVKLLASKTTATLAEAPSHRLVLISGWVADPVAEKAIAEYFVGLRMMMVSAALSIQGHLLGENATGGPDVVRNVERIVGSTSAAMTSTQLVQERNPWMAEALWHLCLHISQQLPSVHPNGRVMAVDYAHSFAKEQGLDVAALYEAPSNTVGLTIVETKAYEKDPTQAVIDAIGMIRSVILDEMDVEIRRAVSIMRDALPANSQTGVTGTFWRNERTFVPNPHYDPGLSKSVNWTRNRTTIKRLGLDRTRVLLMPHPVADFAAFFDRLAALMRAVAREVAGV